MPDQACISAACTCKGESHPGPVRADGSYVGRASPEIDVFEAIVDDNVGMVRDHNFILDTLLTNIRYHCPRSGPRITYVLRLIE